MESFNNKAHAAIDKEKLCILLTGKEDKLGKVTKVLQKELDELHKRKEEATQNLSLDPEKLMFIWSLGFEEKFESESNIEVKIDPQNGILILKGNKELVDSAKMEAWEMLSKVEEDTIELNERKEEFLASGGLDKINEGLRKRKMEALVCLDKSKPKRAKVELLNSQKFNEVDQYLSEQLSEKSLTIEKENVSLLKDEKWRNFRDDLTEKFGIKVFTIGNKDVEVWLTGENSQVQKAYKELKEFVKFNTIISESIVLHRIGRYLEKFGDSKIKEIEQRLKKDFVQLKKGKKEGTLFLQGTKEGVAEAKIMIQEIILDVAHRFIPVEEPGMQKYLKTETGKINLEGLESKHDCTITLTNNNTKQREMEISPVVQPATAAASGPLSTLLCSFETPEKRLFDCYRAMLFLEIYADKDETINKVAKQVEKITSDQMKRERIEEDEIENLSEADISKINKIGKENNVEVKIQKSIKRIIVRGHFEVIGTVMMKIRSILNEIKLAEQEKETTEMVAKGVQWYWVDIDGSQAEYDVSLNSTIEKAFIKGKKSVTFELEEGKCEIVFDKMQETNKKTGEKAEVFRKDLKAKAYTYLFSQGGRY